MDKIKFAALGGLDESGRNCYIIEVNDDIFVCDAGYSVPDKTIPGVDFLLPNFDYLIQNKDRIKAYFMTHGHDENMGCLQYVYDSAPAPIYCTNATKIIIEAEANKFGLKQHFEFRVIDLKKPFEINGRKITPFQTVHNAAYSYGVCIDTDRGNIVYTGDFIVDFSIGEEAYRFDLNTVEEIAKKKTFLLLAESKGANKSGYCSPRHNVLPKIEKYFKEGRRRIFISCFWQNFYRINEICKVAKMYKKKIYFYNDYTRKVMEDLMKCDKSICITPGDIISEQNFFRYSEEDMVILILGRGESLYKEFQKLALLKNDDKKIILNEEDIFINVAIPTPTLETLATKSMDTLYRNKCEVVWIKKKEIASMHAYQDDLKFFLSALKPQYYIPVRGSYVNMIGNAKLALSANLDFTHNNIFLLDNGQQIIFDEKPRPTILTKEQSGITVSSVLVHGLGVSKVASQVIEDRKKLGVDGVVIIVATVSKSQRKIVAGPDCQMRGFVFAKEAEPLLKTVSQIFVEEINEALATETIINGEKIANSTRERAKKYIRRENGREPLILPIVIPTN